MRYECVGLHRLYNISNESVFRLDKPNCALRAHYEIQVYNHRLVLKRCNCHFVKLSRFYNPAENKRYNLEAHLAGRKKAA